MTKRQQWTLFAAGVAVLIALALGTYLGKHHSDDEALPAVESEAPAPTDE